MTVGVVPQVPLRADPGFRRYLVARVMAVFGALATAVVLPVLVYRLTGSPAWTAAVVAAEAITHLLLAPAAAGLTARPARRALLVGLLVAGAALLLSLPVAWWAGGLSPWHVLGVAAAGHGLLVLARATDEQALAVLVGRARKRDGNAAVAGATVTVQLMVPPLLGLAVAIAAPAPLLVPVAIAYLLAAALVRGVLVRAGHHPRTGPDTGEPDTADPDTDEPGQADPVDGRVRALRTGMRLLWRDRSLRSLTLIGGAQAAAVAAWLAVLLPWGDERLGVAPTGDARLALLVSCWGLGAMIAVQVAPMLIRRLGPARLTLEALLAALACVLCVLASGHWLPAVLAAIAWGTAHGMGLAAADAVRDAAVAEADRRRVAAAARALILGGFPLVGAVLAGVVATLTKPGDGLVVAAALVLLGVLAAARSPLRRPGTDRVPGPRPPLELHDP